jgi:ribosomal-protein-serine acetyltransferase
VLTIPPRGELRKTPFLTARLALCPVEVPDAAEMWEAVEESRATLEPWLPWVPFQVDVQSSARYADMSASDWDHGRAIRFAIRDRKTRRFLGIVSLENLQHLHLSADLGYWLRQDIRGRGLMTEAATGAVLFAFRQMGLHRVRVAASTENHRSLAVIRRLGFRFEGIGRHAEMIAGRWLDHAVFAKLSTD